jgi:ABC-2 type transport system ATP-binding protein/sodium transport system ATP-binding protein
MIIVHQLSKHFRQGGHVVTAVDGLSFRVPRGEVYGLLGPNGAGKTTTMRMILGLMAPDGGYAEVEGFRTADAPDEVKRRVGFLSASSGVYQWLTMRESLSFFASVYGLDDQTTERRVDEVTRMLDCSQWLDRRCGTLSTGQKQRVKLAQALVHDPPVLLLDEPTLGLDVVASQVVFEYVRMVSGIGKAVILCTHNMEQAERICHRFGLLNLGRLVHEGTLDALRQATGRPTLVEMFLEMIDTQALVVE